MYKRILLIAMLAEMTAGCGLKQMTTRTVGAISWDGSAVLEKESDVALARDNTIPLIMSLEVFAAGDPNDMRYLGLLAKSYSQYAFGFYEEDMLRYRGRDEKKYAVSRRRADRFYGKAAAYGKRALKQKAATGKAMNQQLPAFEKALKSWGDDDVPVLFWSAFAWANWLNLHKDDPQAFVETPRVQAMVERVVELEPEYNYGVAQSLLGAIHASRPAMLGGDTAQAKAYFDRAVEAAPAYLMNKVMAAQYLAVQTNDRALFERLLAEVMAADPAALPEQRLANELAQRRAALLLEKVDDYF